MQPAKPPAGLTRFIYSGCATGAVYIYDVLTGNVVEQLQPHRSIARDVSWHPYKPSLVSSSVGAGCCPAPWVRPSRIQHSLRVCLRARFICSGMARLWKRGAHLSRKRTPGNSPRRTVSLCL